MKTQQKILASRRINGKNDIFVFDVVKVMSEVEDVRVCLYGGAKEGGEMMIQ